MSTCANTENPDEMQSTLFAIAKKIFKQKNTIFFNYNRTHLDMYNGLSRVNCIKPEGRIH